MIKSTGGVWDKLSDGKKGAVALIAAVVLGFGVGTMTVAQVGLPQRVTTLEAATEAVVKRVSALEDDRETARYQRNYILTLLNWQTCAIEAMGDGEDTRTTCGNSPQYIFGSIN